MDAICPPNRPACRGASAKSVCVVREWAAMAKVVAAFHAFATPKLSRQVEAMHARYDIRQC